MGLASIIECQDFAIPVSSFKVMAPSVGWMFRRFCRNDMTQDNEVPAAIGGYFELELARFEGRHEGGLALNSGRSCLAHVLDGNPGIRRVQLPLYTCDAVTEPLVARQIEVGFYGIDEKLEPNGDLEPAEDEMVIVNNYFGLTGRVCAALASELGDRLIIDCSQAWYAAPATGAHSFYTPRKFFGVPDGAFLHGPCATGGPSERDRSVDRSSHLLKRIDDGPEAGFADFQRNDASLMGQPVRRMSRLTERLLEGFDQEQARQRRCKNFSYLHDALGSMNELRICEAPADGPMVYPLLGAPPGTRERLHARRIFVATYWPNVLEWADAASWEHRLARELLPLPIDQRYAEADMDKIIEALL